MGQACKARHYFSHGASPNPSSTAPLPADSSSRSWRTVASDACDASGGGGGSLMGLSRLSPPLSPVDTPHRQPDTRETRAGPEEDSSAREDSMLPSASLRLNQAEVLSRTAVPARSGFGRELYAVEVEVLRVGDVEACLQPSREHMHRVSLLVIFPPRTDSARQYIGPGCSPRPSTALQLCTWCSVYELSSWTASSFSTSPMGEAESRSCLLARISTGTPWFSEVRVILWSSTLASSIRSSSVESTTNTNPSVRRVYDFHRGRSFSWPPTSHTWKLMLLDGPTATLIFSVLKPLVGIVFTNSFSLSR
ncbi:hypothetical protein EYF80_004820 [Liparis tanakae]|uniref:Uncharacterized protein n=1 Tax=Liparis tanakae TaxID=230148 RepID=A0A4Z2J357_9TELE|nr:hypothetical protein EYF80_004820 [Liparis tanakae]